VPENNTITTFKKEEIMKKYLDIACSDSYNQIWVQLCELWFVLISLLGFYKIKDILFTLGTHNVLHFALTFGIPIIAFLIVIETCRYMITTQNRERLNARKAMNFILKNMLGLYLSFGYVAFYFQSAYRGVETPNFKLVGLFISLLIVFNLPRIFKLLINSIFFVKQIVLNN